MKNTTLTSDENSLSLKPYTRPLAYSERLYIAANNVYTPFCNRMALEGDGYPDIERLRSAVEKASEANPESRLVLKGALWNCYWEDSGVTPPVIEVDGKEWTGFNIENMPREINSKLIPMKGPNCDIIVVRGNPTRIIFRTLHAVMDGRGTMLWMQNIFRALRGEELLSSNSVITDYELVESLQQKEKRKNFKKFYTSITGNVKGNQRDILWCRKTIDNQQKGLVSKAAVLIGKEIWANDGLNARFMIPVDLRNHKKGINSASNLSNPLYIELSPGTTGKEVYDDIKTQLNKKREGISGRFDHLIKYVPISIITFAIKAVLRFQKISKKYGVSGIISSVGYTDLKEYTGGVFNPTSFFLIPPHPSTIPFFVGIVSTGEKTEITGCMAGNHGKNERLDLLMDKIAEALQKPE